MKRFTTLFICLGLSMAGVAQNVGIGTLTPQAPLTVAANRTVLFGADTLNAGTKMIWLPSKGAFRVGSVDADNWNMTKIGLNSFASGYNSMASGDYSTAMGAGTYALGNISTAMGGFTNASGVYATALGGGTIASGDYSTAMGASTIASGELSTAMGEANNSKANVSLAIGRYNDTVAGSNPTSFILVMVRHPIHYTMLWWCIKMVIWF
jgi:hypothetical protein